MRKLLVGALLGLVVSVAPSEAVVVTYTDSTLWSAAVTGVTSIDFEGLAAPGSFVNFGDPGAAVLGGVTFTTPAGTILFVVDPAFSPALYDWGSGAVLSAQFGSPSSMTASLPAGVTAWGTDLMTIVPYAGTIEVLLSTGDVFLASTLDYPTRAFFGVTSDVAIASVTFTFDDGSGDSFFNLDNFAYGSAVPEPGSLILLGAGLAGLGLVRRRMR